MPENPSIPQAAPSFLLNSKDATFVMLENYSWYEEEGKVKIFIDFPNASNISDENLQFVWSSDDLDLKVFKDGAYHRFFIDALFDRIADASLKKKKDKLIITLKKQRDLIWYKLTYD